MEGFLLAYTLVVGAVLMVGLITLIYSLNRVLPYRRPLYWIAIPMDISLQITFVSYLLRRFEPPILLPANTVLFSFLLSLFLVGLLLIILPYVDRLEAKKISPAHIAEAIQEAAHENLTGD